jgi:hypothetical protein
MIYNSLINHLVQNLDELFSSIANYRIIFKISVDFL